MEEAQQLSGRVAVIAAGQIVATGPPAELIAADREAEVSFRVPAGFAAADLSLPAAAAAAGNGSGAFTTASPTATLAPVLAWAAERGLELEELAVRRATLEDVYLDLTANGDGGGA